MDHGGKLFERINGNEPAGAINGIGQTNPGIPHHKASFCPRHGNHRIRELSASRGRVSFVTFL
ncbi:MAG: hypothetical protein C4518_10630 [Desulfobacteraceae bacterium]|nr:MAG: hypothetical protein C4518_10630 [Desulfobacteraceae bacterium]